jgi:hypothetical protein
MHPAAPYIYSGIVTLWVRELANSGAAPGTGARHSRMVAAAAWFGQLPIGKAGHLF